MWMPLSVMILVTIDMPKIKEKELENVCLQCFDAIVWVSGKASGL